jgi:hypothetical protein
MFVLKLLEELDRNRSHNRPNIIEEHTVGMCFKLKCTAAASWRFEILGSSIEISKFTWIRAVERSLTHTAHCIQNKMKTLWGYVAQKFK